MSNFKSVQSSSALRSYSAKSFETIESMRDFAQKLGAIQTTGRVVTRDFVCFVPVAIKFYYGDGNKNLQIINKLLETAEILRGLNSKKLGDYLSNVVPHNIEAGKAAAELAPKFYGKKGGTEQKPSQLTQYLGDVQLDGFLTANQDWTKYSKGNEEKSFDAEKVAKKLLKQLDKADMGAQAFIDILKAQAVKAIQEAA